MITHRTLIGRGFLLLEGKETAYIFRNSVFAGNFSAESNTFYFYGMQDGITKLNDLDMIIKMIEFGL